MLQEADSDLFPLEEVKTATTARADRETATSVWSSLTKIIPMDIRRNLLEYCFFCNENKLFSHFLNTLLHYRTIKLLTIFKILN